ncbi:MAG TPA: hypothetical protein VG963_15460 [Polyangiaceae bacterium]|nr:hypothetical protein [Polyangiaceae bacterium]
MKQVTSGSPRPDSLPAPAPRRAGPTAGARLAPLAAGALGLVGLLWSGRAAATEHVLGVDIGYEDSAKSGTAQGLGVDVYYGPRLDLTVLTLTTELGVGAHDFSGDFNPTVYRATAGGRLGLGVVLRPSVFVHLGAGNMRYDTLGGRDNRWGFASDFGAALDFTILPLIDLGVQFSYNNLAASEGQPAFDWVEYTGRILFVFGH